MTSYTAKPIFNHMVKYKEENLNTTFAALADPTRRAILTRLSKGQARVTELAEPFGMSLPAVSKHLRILEKAELIKRQVDGRVHRFTVNPAPLRSAISWAEKQQHFWEQQLLGLDKYLKKKISQEREK